MLTNVEFVMSSLVALTPLLLKSLMETPPKASVNRNSESGFFF